VKRSQFAVLGLSVGSLIYGVGAVVAIARSVRSHWAPGTLATVAWPLILCFLFSIAALTVHRRTAGK